MKEYFSRSWPAWAILISLLIAILWGVFVEDTPMPAPLGYALGAIFFGSFVVLYIRARRIKIEDMPAADRKLTKRIFWLIGLASVASMLGITFFTMRNEFGLLEWAGVILGALLVLLMLWLRARKM